MVSFPSPVPPDLSGCSVLAMQTVRNSMASRVVLFVAAVLMTVMVVALTVRAVLASTNSRRQIPSCVQGDTQQSFIVLNPRLQTPQWNQNTGTGLDTYCFHAIFQIHTRQPECLSVHLSFCQALCLFICLFLKFVILCLCIWKLL